MQTFPNAVTNHELRLILPLTEALQLDISYDRFIRTTNPAHEKLVADFFQRVWDNGDIYRAVYEGLYCVACEEYKVCSPPLLPFHCPLHRYPRSIHSTR